MKTLRRLLAFHASTVESQDSLEPFGVMAEERPGASGPFSNGGHTHPADVSLARLQEPEEHDHLGAEARGRRWGDSPVVGQKELEDLEQCLRGLGTSPTVEAEKLEALLMLRIFLGEALVDLDGGGLLEGCPVILLENGVSCFPGSLGSHPYLRARQIPRA